MDVLDNLIAYDNALVEWILHAKPTTAAEKQAMQQVFAQRDRLNQQINALVLRRLQLAVTDVTARANQLGDLTTTINATAQSVDTAATVIGLTAQVISLAVTLISLVGA